MRLQQKCMRAAAKALTICRPPTFEFLPLLQLLLAAISPVHSSHSIGRPSTRGRWHSRYAEKQPEALGIAKQTRSGIYLMSETTPVMKPRTLRDGSAWYIELT